MECAYIKDTFFWLIQFKINKYVTIQGKSNKCASLFKVTNVYVIVVAQTINNNLLLSTQECIALAKYTPPGIVWRGRRGRGFWSGPWYILGHCPAYTKLYQPGHDIFFLGLYEPDARFSFKLGTLYFNCIENVCKGPWYNWQILIFIRLTRHAYFSVH